MLGLGSAMLIATYDYWGAYNVCFIGGELKDPGKTIPRAVLLSILLVAGLYLLMNLSVLGVMDWHEVTAAAQSNNKLYIFSTFMQRIYGGWAANLVTATHYVDGVRVSLFARTGILPRPLRRRARRKLLQSFRPRPSHAAASRTSHCSRSPEPESCFAFSHWPT